MYTAGTRMRPIPRHSQNFQTLPRLVVSLISEPNELLDAENAWVSVGANEDARVLSRALEHASRSFRQDWAGATSPGEPDIRKISIYSLLVYFLKK